MNNLPAFLRHEQADIQGILDRHRTPEGQLDTPALILSAVRIRREVQTLETTVNAGNVCDTTRERCAIFQGRDIVHRRLLSEHVPGWDAALSWAHKEFPGCKRAKAMQRAAVRLGLWAGP